MFYNQATRGSIEATELKLGYRATVYAGKKVMETAFFATECVVLGGTPVAVSDNAISASYRQAKQWLAGFGVA